MKSRSHHPAASPTPDDWVDGSWTVDCVCGVNFDDGEEMVNCDECGVWVHTRCSRYVKSEKSFACDKCKSKNSRNDNEETEVAQLLVELPTKTLRMDKPCPPGSALRHRFRLWTEMPMEERVHVQGIPGGEPGLFGGLSSIFTPELWKCTGYVPKKFNFQYKEFSCWDEKQEDKVRVQEVNENPIDNGAGVLFSLSKDNSPANPVAAQVGMKRLVKASGHDRSVRSKNMMHWEGGNLDIRGRSQNNGLRKVNNLQQSLVTQSGKRKKEDMGISKDWCQRKKARVFDEEGDTKKLAPHATKPAPTYSSDAKQLEFYEDSGLKAFKTDSQGVKDTSLKDTAPPVENIKSELGSNELPSEAVSFDASCHDLSRGPKHMENKDGHQGPARYVNSPKTDDSLASLVGSKNHGSTSIKEEEVDVSLDKVNDNGRGSSFSVPTDSQKLDVRDCSNPMTESNQNCQDSSCHILPLGLLSSATAERDNDSAKSRTPNVETTTLNDVQLNGMKSLVKHFIVDDLPQNVKEKETAMSSLDSSEHTVLCVDRSKEAPCASQTGKAVEVLDPFKSKQQMEVPESSVAVEKPQKSLSEHKLDLRPAEESSKSSCTILSSPALTRHKTIASVAKSYSTSSTIGVSKITISGYHRPLNIQDHNCDREHVKLDSSVDNKKEIVSANLAKDEDRHQMPRKMSKAHPKYSVASTLKSSHSNKISHSVVIKKTSLDSKNPLLHSSAKSSSVPNVGVTGSGESAGSLHKLRVVDVQNKISVPGLPERVENVNLSDGQPSTKVNHLALVSSAAPSKSPAALSDEELALLLHQELNSSPRVPRVPRMRHTGILPQLTSPTAASTLMKPTSSAGRKDHSFIPKRKGKDLTKDASRGSCGIDCEAKKINQMPYSPDRKKHDSASNADASTRSMADSGSAKGVHSNKKSTPPVSTACISSGPASSAEINEQNMSSMLNSPRHASDDDVGTVGAPTHQTLPGLIAEIMNQDKSMTYEELCNAVLPHWPNLRKHNGERYAYSSHSQAVLDCLRNRNEWAQLVDRGPKTNASRKRRKLDVDGSGFELEDGEHGKEITEEAESKSFNSRREVFPKGKRKARKRRRLALQGRGIKDIRRRRQVDVVSDDDIGLCSSSTEEESMSSEDEIRVRGTCPVGSETSASSDEAGAML